MNHLISADNSTEAVRVYDRSTGELRTESVLGGRWLRLAYKYPLRPLARLTWFRFRLVSRLLGIYADTRLSRRKINAAIQSLDIDVNEFEKPPEEFRTFNDFFTRRLRPECRSYDSSPARLLSPADCRFACCMPLQPETRFEVKGMQFDLARLLGKPGQSLVPDFSGGTALNCRLSPADCHRFIFPTTCRVLSKWRIDGRLDSVSPIALKLGYPIFEENCREVTVLESSVFGRICYIEIGAFGVGRIEQTYTGKEAAKMQEKGFFEFGGSTIVLLFEPGRIEVDTDLREHSEEGFETCVKMGEGIGEACGK